MENKEAAKMAFLRDLNKVQGVLAPARTDSTNPHFKSKYASLGAVNDAVMGPLSENGFVVLSGGHDIGGKPYLRTTIFHLGGHEESFYYPLIEKTDNPQHIASSVTYARRYSLCALLNLSIEDDDGNAAARTEKTDTPAKTEPKSAPSSEWELIKFVPSAVSKRGDFYDIKSQDGTVYSTKQEDKGKIAEHARLKKLEISISYVVNGKFRNVGKIALSEPEEEIQEVPF